MRIKIKTGMGGSRNGRNRWAGTEELKQQSKKARRAQSKKVTKES